MKIRLRITDSNGSHEVITNLGTIVAWERRFKRKASDLAHGVGSEDLAFLAYEASKQHGVTVPAVFDDYIKRLDGVEVVSETPENPTGGAISDEN